ARGVCRDAARTADHRRPDRDRRRPVGDGILGEGVTGIVARVDLRGVVVLFDDGRLELITVRKRLMDPGARLGNAIVVGDAVTIADGSVAAIAPRRNTFQR